MTAGSGVRQWLKQGLIGGLAFGAAAGTVHLAVGIGLILKLNMPPLTWFAAKSIVFEVTLAVLVGLILSPLYRLRAGHWLHLGAMMLAWLGMELSVAINVTELRMWVAPTVIAGLLVLAGRWLATRNKRAPVVLAVAVPLVVLAIPEIKAAASPVEVADVARGQAPRGAPDVVMVVLDTVRAQSVSAYGYERKTTPNFDQFAKEGLLFEDANAPATWSLPAHASLFTGTFPSTHGAHGETRYLDGSLPTLAETMEKAGWETRCFTANPHITDNFGLVRGFAWSDQAWLTGAGGRGFSFIYRFMDTLGFSAEDKGGGQVVANIERWLSRRPKDAPPAFVFVNFLEAHFPFHQLPDEYLYAFGKRPFEELRSAGLAAFGAQFGTQLSDEEREAIRGPLLDMYDAGVLYSDALFGKVVAAWKQRGTYDDTVFVVLSDHGEMVGEHGAYGHVASVYHHDLSVPLAIRYPERIKAGSKVSVPISTTGVFGTIMDLARIQPPETLQVGSLLPAVEGRPAGQPVLSERFEEELLAARFKKGTANGTGPLLNPRGRYRIYRLGDLKLVKTLDGNTHLFDLEKDPNEEQDLAGSYVGHVARLEQELKTWETALGLPSIDGKVSGGSAPVVDAAAMEQLRALGYVE